uniref:Uncharacterized protein n=1 Tax=Octopus bimaculoides TaxID=37653 RepID=A0A0L8FNM1_OCTBM
MYRPPIKYLSLQVILDFKSKNLDSHMSCLIFLGEHSDKTHTISTYTKDCCLWACISHKYIGLQ